MDEFSYDKLNRGPGYEKLIVLNYVTFKGNIKVTA